MKTILLLDKEDIECSFNGSHIEIKTSGNTTINLNPEAYKELFNDLKALIESVETKSAKWSHDEYGSSAVLTDEQVEINKSFNSKEEAFKYWENENKSPNVAGNP